MYIEHLEKYKTFMTIISVFLVFKLEIHNFNEFNRFGKQKAWRARILYKKDAIVLVNYFYHLPMFNFKYLNYPNGCKVYDILIVKKEHLGKNKLDI